MGGEIVGNMKRMYHEQHGHHYAYSEAEEKTLKESGWVEYVKPEKNESPQAELKILHLKHKKRRR